MTEHTVVTIAKQGTSVTFKTATHLLTVEPINFFRGHPEYTPVYLVFRITDTAGKLVCEVDLDTLRFFVENN